MTRTTWMPGGSIAASAALAAFAAFAAPVSAQDLTLTNVRIIGEARLNQIIR